MLRKEKHTKYQCEDCKKYFYDKSTLNRHGKTHLFSCEQCKHTFQNKDVLNTHKLLHRKTREQNISENKVALTLTNLESILDIQKHIERLMLIFTNRGQAVELAELKNQIERISKKTLNDRILVAMLSIDPEAYSLYHFNNKVYIKLVSTSN
jgi:ribosomal protein L37AE/L43A